MSKLIDVRNGGVQGINGQLGGARCVPERQQKREAVQMAPVQVAKRGA